MLFLFGWGFFFCLFAKQNKYMYLIKTWQGIFTELKWTGINGAAEGSSRSK